MKANTKSTRRSAETQKPGRTFSAVWETMRDYWPERIRAGVEDIMARGGITIGDVVALELAECMQILADGEVDESTKAIASKLRHLRVLCERMGATGDANTRTVAVPAGVFVPRPEDVEADDLVH